jgi:hypothetical protein
MNQATPPRLLTTSGTLVSASLLSFGLGGHAGSGVMVEILDSGVQTQKFLCSFLPLKSVLLTSLTPCGTVRLLDDIVAAPRGDHLLAARFPVGGLLGTLLAVIVLAQLFNPLLRRVEDRDYLESLALSRQR